MGARNRLNEDRRAWIVCGVGDESKGEGEGGRNIGGGEGVCEILFEFEGNAKGGEGA